MQWDCGCLPYTAVRWVRINLTVQLFPRKPHMNDSNWNQENVFVCIDLVTLLEPVDTFEMRWEKQRKWDDMAAVRRRCYNCWCQRERTITTSSLHKYSSYISSCCSKRTSGSLLPPLNYTEKNTKCTFSDRLYARSERQFCVIRLCNDCLMFRYWMRLQSDRVQIR